MVDKGCEGDVENAKNLLRFAYRGRASQFWMDGSCLGCPSKLLSSFGSKIRELGCPVNDLSQADVFTERRGRAQGVQCFQPKGSSRCAPLSRVRALSVWTQGRRSGSHDVAVTSH